jgi:hypothetical protein
MSVRKKIIEVQNKIIDDLKNGKGYIPLKADQVGDMFVFKNKKGILKTRMKLINDFLNEIDRCIKNI